MSGHATEELQLQSHAVTLVRSSNHRSSQLPALCDVCLKAIVDYPYVAKHSTNGHHRKYHVDCALKTGVVLVMEESQII